MQVPRPLPGRTDTWMDGRTDTRTSCILHTRISISAMRLHFSLLLSARRALFSELCWSFASCWRLWVWGKKGINWGLLGGGERGGRTEMGLEGFRANSTTPFQEIGVFNSPIQLPRCARRSDAASPKLKLAAQRAGGQGNVLILTMGFVPGFAASRPRGFFSALPSEPGNSRTAFGRRI